MYLCPGRGAGATLGRGEPMMRHLTTSNRSFHAHRRLALGAAAFTAALLGTGQQASAQPIEHEHFHDESPPEVSTECPGLTLLIAEVVDGSFLLVPHGPDGLAYGMEHVRGTTTVTNLATDKTFTINFNFATKDLSVTDNGDGTLTIEAISAGRQQVFGPDGERLFIDAGQTAFSVLIDDAGTPTDPSDDEFLEFLGISKQVGRLDTAERDFCADVAEFTA